MVEKPSQLAILVLACTGHQEAIWQAAALLDNWPLVAQVCGADLLLSHLPGRAQTPLLGVLDPLSLAWMLAAPCAIHLWPDFLASEDTAGLTFLGHSHATGLCFAQTASLLCQPTSVHVQRQ
jgi:hypothetical protein